MHEVPILIANASVSSRLDCCKSPLRGLSRFSLKRLQNNQNTLAHIVTDKRKYAHVTPILKQPLWLLCCVQLHFQNCNIDLQISELFWTLLFTRHSHTGHQYIEFHLYTLLSTSHSDTFEIVLMLPRSEMTFTTMYAMQHHRLLQEKSSKLGYKSLSVIAIPPLVCMA